MQFKEVTDFFGFTQPKKEDQEKTDLSVPKVLQEEEIRESLFVWEAKSRPELNLMSERKTKMFLIAGIAVCLVLVVMQEFFLILVSLSLIFAVYMLSQQKPEDVRYEITNQGLKYDTVFYRWSDMKFFFEFEAENNHGIAIDMLNTLPARLFLAYDPSDRDKIVSLLEKYVHMLEEEPKNFTDRAYESIIGKLDLNN